MGFGRRARLRPKEDLPLVLQGPPSQQHGNHQIREPEDHLIDLLAISTRARARHPKHILLLLRYHQNTGHLHSPNR